MSSDIEFDTQEGALVLAGLIPRHEQIGSIHVSSNVDSVTSTDEANQTDAFLVEGRSSKLMDLFAPSDVRRKKRSTVNCVTNKRDLSSLMSVHRTSDITSPGNDLSVACGNDFGGQAQGTSKLMSLFVPLDEEKTHPCHEEPNPSKNLSPLRRDGNGAESEFLSLQARSTHGSSTTRQDRESMKQSFIDEDHSCGGSESSQHILNPTIQSEDHPLHRLKLERQKTEQRNNHATRHLAAFDHTPLLANEEFRNGAFPTPHNLSSHKQIYETLPSPPAVMEPILEDVPDRCRPDLYGFAKQHLKAETFLGGFIFLLYHIVFCLAMGSTVSAGNLDIMAKMAGGGIIFLSPIYILALGDEIPSQFPTADLFLAPFMAKLAAVASETLSNDEALKDRGHDEFLSTFAVLASIGMFGSGVLIMLATTFKLANLGSFLPFPVLCGFFSAVGVLMWTLALGVDTGGKSIVQVLESFDSVWNASVHHLPSFLAGSIMKIYGPSNPFFSTYTIVATVVLTYGTMLVTGTSLAEAKEAGWFWTHNDLLPPPNTGKWLPPAPFGVVLALSHARWDVVLKGLKTTTALSFLYLIRCSLHATALKKNVSNLKRVETHNVNVTSLYPRTDVHKHSRRWTEDIDIEVVHTKDDSTLHTNVVVTTPRIPTVPLQKVLIQYGYVQFLAAALGSFGVTPAVAAMDTMYKLGADGRAPQLLSLLFLLVFYLTDFRLVAYIPKMSFSCLIVLAFLDMISTWFVESYFKTKEKAEWLVVPVIVVASFALGLLNSVFLGIALSTFIFVASFFRSGVVKFLANGLSIRSTIERSLDASEWLSRHGGKIQILVMQNYLFFGNASSMLDYVSTMFEGVAPGEDSLHYDLTPPPKYIVLDLTLVTGMDTSTAAVFTDIKTVCSNHAAKLFVSGLASPLRETLALGNFKPERGERSKRTVRFFSSLDAALGKAEDCLLEDEMINHDALPIDVFSTHDEAASFEQALKAIDEQHGLNVCMHLMDFFLHTTPIVLEPGDHLLSSQGGPVSDDDRGLSFLACGLLKLERDSSMSTSRNSLSIRSLNSLGSWTGERSLSDVHARDLASNMGAGDINASFRCKGAASYVRLARVGPGWVAGTLDSIGVADSFDRQVAVSRCKIHHLPHHKINDVEEKDPVLVLRLYKLLSHLTAKRQEVHIGQLMTLHSIMTSPAAGKPIRRRRICNS